MSEYTCGMGDPLDMLAEECSEVIKERMKIARFGVGGTPQWREAGNPSPKQLLVKELGEVLVVIKILVERGFCTFEELGEAMDAKVKRLNELFGYEQVPV